VPVEVKTSCVMLPPSTIEAVPNVVEQGQQFTIRVKNSPADAMMEISGLSKPVVAVITKGGSWSQGFSSDECSQLGSCLIHFEFTGQKHRMCKSTAEVVVSVKKPATAKIEEPADNGMVALITLFVIVVGTAGAIALNRYI